MRWDSPFVLAAAGTIAIHLMFAVVADALVFTHPVQPDTPPPKVKLVDVRVVKPPPPPRHVEPPKAALPRPVAPVHHVSKAVAHAEPSPPVAPPPPPPSAPVPDTGGGPVLAMNDIAPAAEGVAVARGTSGGREVARGGSGGGTGAGSGRGSADEVPKPMSVATIKVRAMPRGDYSYFDAAADYPLEAKQLGVEGTIRVRLVVDDHGKVKSRTLLNKLGHGLDELALARAAAIEFTPALDSDDHPVASVVIWTFTMTLPK
ncbi:MAG TPA: TonB family protein [Kofleriaceae bacterium]|nr:TonB family protein [Kofleriaceae bacterium]